MTGDALFRSYVASYAEAIERLRYADLARLQPAPHGDVFHGGGGTAYALWRLGRTRRARRWIAEALADRRRTALGSGDHTPPVTSYQCGRAGLYWVQALVGGARRDAAVTAYLRLARRTGETIEIMNGAAGHLTGARLLLARFDDPRVRRTAVALAADLGDRLRARSVRRWRPEDAAGGFAHDWAGVLHAMLEWHRAAAEPVPGWLLDSMRNLARAWSRDTVRWPELAGSWCQGAAGATLLWCSAYRATCDRAFLRCAREAGRLTREAELLAPDLCCGAGGAAFALLELERTDPGRGWRRHARDLGARAIQASPAMTWPNGLFRGHPGLVCLALDLVADHPVGFPMILG